MNLRTIIIFALLVCACILSLHAQVGEQRHNFAVGVNGGINLNSVSFSPSVKQKNLMGINGGVTARYISEKYFSMICGAQIELNFSQHGWDEYYEDYPTLSYKPEQLLYCTPHHVACGTYVAKITRKSPLSALQWGYVGTYR